MRNFIVSIPP